MNTRAIALAWLAGCTGALEIVDTDDTGVPGAVPVTSEALWCDYDAYYTPPPEALVAVDLGGGLFELSHTALYWGCAPVFSVSAVADPVTSTVDITYGFANDYCDGVCLFHASYVLGPLDAGTWTLTAGPVATEVVVY